MDNSRKIEKAILDGGSSRNNSLETDKVGPTEPITGELYDD